MHPVLLIDFGSTYTKVCAVDTAERRVIGSAQAFTTATTDIAIGLEAAIAQLKLVTGSLDYVARLACSSAAGGLRMVACGLVPALTSKAARFAAFGAGAKVIKTYAYELTREDAQEIRQAAPDILLLVGGTDGGNSDVVTRNAQVIAGIEMDFPVVYAGNRAAKEECVRILTDSPHAVHTAPNVMPVFGSIDVQPVQFVLRDIFLKNIIHCKGLSKTEALLDGILMPTPAAVLTALSLLSGGTQNKKGIGELVAVDLGGATTDVYSIASGLPTRAGTFLHGLSEPYVKRTVEGDIGMRFSAHGVVESAGMEELLRLSGLSEDKASMLLMNIAQDPSVLPRDEDEQALDFALAVLAIRLGITRHAGTLQEIYTPVGPMYQQVGKDLSQIDRVILTGGALIYSDKYAAIAREAVQVADPSALIPRKFALIRDRGYILSAMGLLAGCDQDAAFEILDQHFGKEEAYAACQ